jgi:hypothetical protein
VLVDTGSSNISAFLVSLVTIMAMFCSDEYESLSKEGSGVCRIGAEI